MKNCLNVPEEVLESMLIIAWEFMDRDDYREKIGGTNWMSPGEAGPAWQEVRACFERVAGNVHQPRPKEAVEKIIPILEANGLMLNGSQITRQAG
ncbi:MAG: hypothetical protein AB8G05_18475 [Oligoflexales bacterium]